MLQNHCTQVVNDLFKFKDLLGGFERFFQLWISSEQTASMQINKVSEKKGETRECCERCCKMLQKSGQCCKILQNTKHIFHCDLFSMSEKFIDAPIFNILNEIE